MAIGAILSKGVLIKGSIVAAGGTGLGVTWWQVYDNVRPKELAEEGGEEFILSNLTNNSNTDLDDIPYLTFSKEKYRSMFRDGDCIKKYLPTKIDDISELTIESGNIRGRTPTLDAHGFAGQKISDNNHRAGVGFVGTEGCLDVNIKYSNEEKNEGMIGRMELVFWNEPVKSGDINVDGYGMVLSSIISNLEGKFNFVNKLSFLKQDKNIWFSEKRNEAKWDVLGSAIWIDKTYSKIKEEDKYIRFEFGNESFSFKIEEENKNIKQLKNPQEYKKLARWLQGSKEQGNKEKLLGHWSISIGGEISDLWTNLDLLKLKSEFASEFYYHNKKWYKDQKFKYGFGNFDRYNPVEKAGTGYGGHNRMSEYGTWVDVLEECVNKKSSYKNICFKK